MNLNSAYLLQLGSTPDLSFAELKAIAPLTVGLERVGKQLALMRSLPATVSTAQLIDLLGGTVKIARVLATFPSSDDSVIAAYLKQHLLEQDPTQRITLAIAEWGRDHLPSFDVAGLKSWLQDQERSVRYVTGSRAGLSAAVLLHQPGIQEFVIATTSQETYLAESVAVQNIDEWTQIDRGKPFAEHKRGLLPPKVARIMVNLALGKAVFESDQLTKAQLWDPYCGAGTILLEAARVGVHLVYGSDNDQRAVTGAQTNIDWFAHTITTPLNSQSQQSVFLADATHIDRPPFQPASITAVVTEPFLGRQTPDTSQILNIRKGLAKLYLGAFKAWRPWLAQGATIVHITPRWASTHRSGRTNQTLDMHEFIDNLQTIGYTTTSDPIIYARPNAQVQREIWTLTYRST